MLDRLRRGFGEAAVRGSGERRADGAVPQPPRRVRIDLVPPRDARDLLAREQDHVEHGSGEPDQPFDPPLQCKLAR